MHIRPISYILNEYFCKVWRKIENFIQQRGQLESCYLVYSLYGEWRCTRLNHDCMRILQQYALLSVTILIDIIWNN